MTSAANKLFTVFGGGASLDPAVAAFAATTGATDTAGLDALIRYVRAEGLLSNFVIYPMKSAQNYGTGPTVAPLGGLTSNAMTLANSPTWGVSGITFNGSNQNGGIVDFLEDGTITGWSRHVHTSPPSATSAIFGQYSTVSDQRSVALLLRGADAGDPYSLNRSSDGTSASVETWADAGGNYSTNDRSLVAQWVDGDGRFFWANKTPIALSLFSGFANTARKNSAAHVTYASLPAGNFTPLRGIAFALCRSALTTEQREQITDLINAL